MQFKDYYKILEVEPESTTEEIKQAHRRLAFKYHPDQNPGNSMAEEKFKDINEAYHVVGDPEKRKLYDKLTLQWIKSKARQDNFDNFARKWGQKAGVAAAATTSAFPGTSEFFRTFFSGFKKPRNLHAKLDITLEEAFSGAKPVISVGNKRLEVKVPPGVGQGQILKLREMGPEKNGQKADILLKISIKEHPVFKREGKDLYADLPLNLYTAILGGEKIINSLRGSVKLTIKPGTQPGQQIRLKNYGMPKQNGYGDLYLNLVIKIPQKLSSKEKELFEQLQNISTTSKAN